MFFIIIIFINIIIVIIIDFINIIILIVINIYLEIFQYLFI